MKRCEQVDAKARRGVVSDWARSDSSDRVRSRAACADMAAGLDLSWARSDSSDLVRWVALVADVRGCRDLSWARADVSGRVRLGALEADARAARSVSWGLNDADELVRDKAFELLPAAHERVLVDVASVAPHQSRELAICDAGLQLLRRGDSVAQTQELVRTLLALTPEPRKGSKPWTAYQGLQAWADETNTLDDVMGTVRDLICTLSTKGAQHA